MKFHLITFLLVLCFSCSENTTTNTEKSPSITKEQIQIKSWPMTASIRAILAIDENNMWFGGSKGQFGYTEDGGTTWHIDSIQTDKISDLEFRGIAKTSKAIFLLGVASPALLFKSEDNGANWEIVYEENHEAAFYDAIAFWDDQQGIAMGDPTDGCLSIILTNDGGNTWTKVPCDLLPASAENEAAFAASNANISLAGDHAWVVSGGAKARVFHSPDRGKTWEVFETPIAQGGKMTGIFSSQFYDTNRGIIFGGDWEKKEQNKNNKAITSDGGKTWSLIADGQHPGYRSSVRYVPNSDAKELFAVGIPGISYSEDGGQHWISLSDSSFYTIRICDTGKSAWLAGGGKVAKMNW